MKDVYSKVVQVCRVRHFSSKV